MFGDKKAGFVLLKNTTTGSTNWINLDGVRGDLGLPLFPNLSNAEGGTPVAEGVAGGFVITNTSNSINGLNDEFLFLAFAETANDGTRATTDYDYATSADTLTIQSLISFSEGFNDQGEINNQEDLNTTFTLGSGFEDKQYYLYKDKGGAVGVTEYRPLEQQDYSGVASPLGGGTRTTAKHFDYESSTGVASASLEGAGTPAWEAFDQSPDTNSYWQANTSTNSQLQYKHSEPRVLKSWRSRSRNTVATQDPRRFTIEGSNDGLNWAAIDSTYTTSDYTGNGAALWGDLQDTSANTTAYLYHRINITANNGDASFTSIGELEFNTITPSDRYDVQDGVMYDSTNTPIARVYLGEFRTDTNGDVINSTIVNYQPSKTKKIDGEYHGDLTVRGELENVGVATAWVNFDGTQNPPLIRGSFNVADVVDNSAGNYTVVFETPMDNMGFSAVAISTNVTCEINSITTSGANVIVRNGSNNGVDDSLVSVQVFGGKEPK